MLKSLKLLLPALVLFGAPRLSSAADLHVPNQFATIQAALNAAMPGDTIHVHGGVYGPITISSAVTIVGDSNATIDNSGSVATQPPNVTLSGHGYGNVILIGLRLRGSTNGFFQAWQGARVKGSGFVELHIQDCILDPPTWYLMTGIGHGACGIDVTIPYLLLTHSTVTGGSEGTDNTLGIGPVNGYAAVKNPSGTVAALDSTIIGGDGMDAYLFPQQFPGGGCPSVPGPGMGGPGIAAAEIFQAGSTVKGGMGSEIYEINVLKCHQGSGPAYTTITVVSFPKTLTEFGIPKLGGNWTLQWTSTSSTVALLVTSDPVKPFLYVGVGWFFSNLMETHVAEMAPGGPQPHARVLTIPVNPALVGLELVAQVWDPAVGMGRPIVRAVVP